MAKKKQQENSNEGRNPYIELVPSGNGRPSKRLTQKGKELVATLSQFMATDEEIAAALSDEYEKITPDTLVNSNNKETFLEYKNKGQSRGKTSLRSWQFDTAKKGNATMQIWLGRQYLGQTDRQEIEEIGGKDIVINVAPATVEDINEKD